MRFYPDKNTLRKPNAALVMVPRTGKLTSVGRKIYNVILLSTQRQVAEFREGNRTIAATHLFTERLQNIVDPISVGESNLRTVAKRYLREMRRTEVDWEAPDASTGVVWNCMGLLSQVRLEVKNGSTWVSWALPPDLLAAVSDPERYTPLDLTYMAKLKSYVAIALYEICLRYKNNPTGVTSKNPPDWWVASLMSAPAEVNVVTGLAKRREWRKLKNEQVLRAIEEINEHTDLTIALHEAKEGRAVVAVQFVVKKKPGLQELPKLRLPSELVGQALAASVPQSVLGRHLADGYPHDSISNAMNALGARVKRADLPEVASPAAYLSAILNQSGRTSGQAAMPTDLFDEPVEAVHRAPPDLVPKDQWREARRQAITAEMIALSDGDLSEHVEAAAGRLQAAGLLTATTKKNLMTGQWKKGGFARSAVFEAYALKVHGQRWFESADLSD